MSSPHCPMTKSITFVFLLTIKCWLDKLRTGIAARLASIRRAELAQQQAYENGNLHIAIRQKDQELVDARDQIESLQGELAKYQLQVEQLQHANDIEKAELEKLKHALDNGELEKAHHQIETLQAEVAERQKHFEKHQLACRAVMEELEQAKAELHEALHGHGLLSEVLRKKIAKEPWEAIKAWLYKEGLTDANVGLFLRETCLKNDSYRRAARDGKPSAKASS